MKYQARNRDTREEMADVGIAQGFEYALERAGADAARSKGATLSEADVIAFCKRTIAHYKVPRHIRFVDAFPMTITGKAQKFIMRERMAEELKVQEAQTA